MSRTTADFATRYRTLAAAFTGKVEAVRDGQWDLPSTCADWNVRDIVRHVITTEHAMLERVDIDVPLTADVDTDPVGAWHELRDVVQGVLDDTAKASLEYEGMGGTTTVGQTINDFGGFDLVVHGWDLAHSTGQDDTMPADEVEAVLEMSESLGDLLRSSGSCGPEIEVGPDAGPQQRLLARLGRTA
jgi:uncharacterized protein (TIGR03086 family)